MLTRWRRHRAARRVRPGDGHPLERFRWWHMFLGRALLHLERPDTNGRLLTWSIDVRHQGDRDGSVVAHLYRDCRHHASSTVSAVLPVPGGAIEVATSGVGVKRCEYVDVDGSRHRLVPDPLSAEGRRARLEETRPVLSRGIGFLSVITIVVGLGLTLLQVLESVSRVPPIAASVGVLVSPIHLPLWLNMALAVAAALAAIERALRLRNHWLLDG